MKQLLLTSMLMLSACASVTAVPLNADGTRKEGPVEEGIRYYLPKPYLLITELPEAPPAPAKDSTGGGSQGAGKSHTANGGSPSPTDQSSTKSDNSTPTANTPTASASDTAFAASMASYSLKLIYLPDYSSPMALQTSTGLFGTVSVGPTLQDGWMLTGVTESIDSGTAATLSSLASLVSAGMGGGAAAAKPKTGGGLHADAEAKAQQYLATWGASVLQPGLYEFSYGNDGKFQGIFPVTIFCGNAVRHLIVTEDMKAGKVRLPGVPECKSVTR